MSDKRNSKSSKWILGTTPQVWVAEIAEIAVKSRLESVRRCLKRVRRDWHREPEHVHQLRVASRRAQMAFQVFADYLPEKQTRACQRRLKRLRRAANAARDLDVLLLRYQGPSSERIDAKSWERFVRYLRGKRREAQGDLDPLVGRRGRQEFKRLIGQLEPCEPSSGLAGVKFRELANQQLRPLLETFFQLAHQGWSDIESLHRLRIAGKRVRYVLELLAGAFPVSEFKSIYRSFCELQEQFGTVNDHAAAVETLGSFRKTCGQKIRDVLDQQLQVEQQQLTGSRQQLEQSWAAATWRELEYRFQHLLIDVNAGSEKSESIFKIRETQDP